MKKTDLFVTLKLFDCVYQGAPETSYECEWRHIAVEVARRVLCGPRQTCF